MNDGRTAEKDFVFQQYSLYKLIEKYIQLLIKNVKRFI